MDSSGFLVGDPVRFKWAPYLGKVIYVSPVTIGVRPIGKKFTTTVFLPDELEVCRCVHRSPYLTPLGQARRELQRA